MADALDKAQKVLKAVRASLEGGDHVAPLKLPEITTASGRGKSQKKHTLKLDFVPTGDAKPRAGALYFGFSAGISLSRTRGWVPTFRAHIPPGHRPEGPARKVRSKTQPRRGVEAVVKAINDYCHDQNLRVGNNDPYFAVSTYPLSLASKKPAKKSLGREFDRRHVRRLNGLPGSGEDWPSLVPGAGVTTDNRAHFGSLSHFACTHSESEGTSRIREFSLDGVPIRVEELTSETPSLQNDVRSGEHSLLVSRKTAPDAAVIAIGSGHALTQHHTVQAGSPVYRVNDITPNARGFTVEVDNEADGVLVDAFLPDVGLPLDEDIGLVRLNADALESFDPALLIGGTDSRIFGLVREPTSFIESAVGHRRIPVTLRGLGSGVAPGLITCFRQEVLVRNGAGVQVEYQNLIEIVGTDVRIGRHGDSGGSVTIAESPGRSYLLGTIALGSEAIYDLPQELVSQSAGVAYATVAETSLLKHNLRLLVEGSE